MPKIESSKPLRCYHDMNKSSGELYVLQTRDGIYFTLFVYAII